MERILEGGRLNPKNPQVYPTGAGVHDFVGKFQPGGRVEGSLVIVNWDTGVAFEAKCSPSRRGRSMTDDQLLTDFLADRDGPAFEALVRRYGPMILRTCRDLMDNADDAEDAFQATFLILVRQAGSIRDRDRVGRWLYEVACRIARRSRARAARRRFLEGRSLAIEPACPTEPDASDREMKPILHEEICRLPRRLRDPIVLCYFEGLTVENAARRLDCPVGTLKSRLIKAREILRGRLARRGLAASAVLLLFMSLEQNVRAEDPLPPDLLAYTVQAGKAGSSAVVSDRVARMVRDEEGRPLGVGPVVPWLLLVATLLGIGVEKLAQGWPGVSSDRDRIAAGPGSPLAPVIPSAFAKASPTGLRSDTSLDVGKHLGGDAGSDGVSFHRLLSNSFGKATGLATGSDGSTSEAHCSGRH
jgi:RNA polymerase sigma factor (sigma-70 family)